MKKDKKNRFNTPEGYFENFNDRLMDRIQSEEAQEDGAIIPNIDGFAIPDGYFDVVTNDVLSKTAGKETKVISLKSNRNFYYSVAAVAAIFVLIFSLTWNSNPEPITFDDLANAEIEAYLESTDFEMTSYEIAEVVSLEEMELTDMLGDNLDSDIILTFLDENVEYIEELNLEDTDYE